MSKVDTEEQQEALLALEWLQYCEGEPRLMQYQPLDFESWKEKKYGNV